jgi:signal peptidase II
MSQKMSLSQLNKHLGHRGAYLSVTLLLITIATDQYTKFLAEKYLQKSDEISFLNNFLKFSLIENHGGFLGIVSSLPENVRFFFLNICVSFLLLGCLVYLFYPKKRTIRYDIPVVFVTGGGISNLLDRLLNNGGVTDFLSLGIGNFRTGIFNLADMYILIGSFILGSYLFSSPARSR